MSERSPGNILYDAMYGTDDVERFANAPNGIRSACAKWAELSSGPLVAAAVKAERERVLDEVEAALGREFHPNPAIERPGAVAECIAKLRTKLRSAP